MEEAVEPIQVDKIAHRFDYWMVMYTGHPKQSDVDHYIDWLSFDDGKNQVKTYEGFVAVTRRLNSMGYKIDPIPSEEDFKFESTILKCANRFNRWMVMYTGHPNQSDGDHLVEWLRNDHGKELIGTYERFVALAKSLESFDYKIDPIPSETDFKLENTAGIHAHHFDWWMKNTTGHRDITDCEHLYEFIHCELKNNPGVTFDRFVALAEKVNGMGYKKLNGEGYKIVPPRTEEEFAQSMNVSKQQVDKDFEVKMAKLRKAVKSLTGSNDRTLDF